MALDRSSSRPVSEKAGFDSPPGHRPTVTFRRVRPDVADALGARGWRCIGANVGHDYASLLMMRRETRDDAPAGEDSYGGE